MAMLPIVKLIANRGQGDRNQGDTVYRLRFLHSNLAARFASCIRCTLLFLPFMYYAVCCRASVKYDRIAIDFLDWLRQLLWHREDVIKHRPYDVLRTMRGKYGLISKVDRRTPRAISTYTFSPFATTSQSTSCETSICVVITWGQFRREIDRASRWRQPANAQNFNLQRLSLLGCARLLRSQELFSGEYDLQGKTRCHTDRRESSWINRLLLQRTRPKAIDWKFEVAAAVKEVLGECGDRPHPIARLHHRGHVDRRWEATERHESQLRTIAIDRSNKNNSSTY
jgi:hypothetical protein